MSIPIHQITCNKCNSEASNSVMRGETVYTDGEDEFHCNKTYGWCEQCREIVAMEDFDNIDSVLDQIQRNLTWQNDTNASFWSNLGRLLFKAKRERENEYTTDITKALKTLTLANKRRGTERCLSCASYEVTRVDAIGHALSQVSRREGGGHSVDFVHPHCGGTLYVEPSIMRFSFRRRKKIFDVYGNFLERIDY